jgi:mannose-6-phosphate isomerase-like protein (cupin superfamily)
MVIRKSDVNAFAFDGLSIRDYTAKLNEQSSFAVIEVSPGVSHKWSWSKRSDKYYYVLDGEIEFSINDENVVLDKGDFCVIRKGDKFKYRNEAESPATLILVHTPRFVLEEEVYE